MAAAAGRDGLLDMEKELTCSICTDILYQPLTLLDCLHSFCGSCLKEWFAWQAASASSSRRTTVPYTCPSCREHVRGTKADWRLTTLLEGYLKANPQRGKSEEEKEEMRAHYKPGDDVIPKVQIRRDDADSDDERLLTETMELSMADLDPETTRRRAERGERRQRHRRWPDGSGDAPLSEARLREHNANQPHMEHQPSLRSLLSSSSQVDSHDVQQEILQSIYAEGMLDGIDLDNLTPEQEEELTERIANAYRERKRQRGRSSDRERHQQGSQSPRSATTGAESQSRRHARTDSASAQQPRARPPISRPHLFEPSSQDPATRQRRSASATSQRSNRSAQRLAAPPPVAQGARSAIDLSERPRLEAGDGPRRRRLSHGSAPSATDAENRDMRARANHARAASHDSRQMRSEAVPPSAVRPLEALRRQEGAANRSSPSLSPTAASNIEHSVRPATSAADLAPEPLTNATPVPEAVSDPTVLPSTPPITCSRCDKPNIQRDLHYNCPWCRNGSFNLCLPCYRRGQGCDHWFGFGYMAYEHWQRQAPPEEWQAGYERPHVLIPRRYVSPTDTANAGSPPDALCQEGAFCESCLAYASECYWYCYYCLDGAWGFCNACVQQGRHCTHPLLPVTHLATLIRPHQDPAKTSFVQMPHLRQDSYVLLPVTTDCDICHRSIPPNWTRFHCYQCSSGDYDMCADCYYNLVATGKISQSNGPNGWRRCLQGHRMAIVRYQDLSQIGQQRVIDCDMVGGWRHKDVPPSAGETPPPPPPDSSLGTRCLARWSYFPQEGVTDELPFPKNAEITEVEKMNDDWSVGVYAGRVGLLSSNYVEARLDA